MRLQIIKKIWDIQIGVETLLQTQIPNTPKLLSLTNTNQRTKGQKYQIQIAQELKREPQIKSKSCNTPRESKSPNRRTKIKRQHTFLTIPNCNSQISNNQPKRSSLSLSLSLIFCSSITLT